MNSVVHFDIPMKDQARAKNFYKIFGWELTDWPGMDTPYTMAITTPVDETTRMPKTAGAINGGLNGDPNLKAPVIVLSTDNIDATVQMVKQAGGSVVREKQNVGGMGWYAFIQDTEGNILGLWQDIPQQK